MNKELNHGFLQPESIEPEEFILGGLFSASKEVLRPDGQWDAYLPDSEVQNKNFIETNGCVSYGTLNVIEILLNYFDETKNFSDRFTAIVSETKPNSGNNPHTVAQSIRHFGCILEDTLPFNDSIDTVEKYYSPIPMTDSLLEKGKNWLENYKFEHEWVFYMNEPLNEKQGKLKEVLRYSPVGVSVVAWFQDENGLYFKPAGIRDGHWTTLFGYEEGKYWKIFDSYDNTIKKLNWNYAFGYAKRYTIKKKETQKVNQDNWLIEIIKNIINLFRK